MTVLMSLCARIQTQMSYIIDYQFHLLLEKSSYHFEYGKIDVRQASNDTRDYLSNYLTSMNRKGIKQPTIVIYAHCQLSQECKEANPNVMIKYKLEKNGNYKAWVDESAQRKHAILHHPLKYIELKLSVHIRLYYLFVSLIQHNNCHITQ